MLAFHPKWEAFFTNLRFVVLDEVHTYRGVFGSHVANLLRRLLRVAEIYGARPQIIACSATIANPGELAARLTGACAGRRRRQRRPRRRPVLPLPQPVAALPGHAGVSKLLREAVREDLATICFTKSRKNTELVYTWAVHGDARLRRLNQRVPLRVPARGAARDRGEALHRRAQSRGEHVGPRDGDRHRRAGRLHPRRLSRLDHLDLAARRARRAPGPRVARPAARGAGRSRPVLHEAPVRSSSRRASSRR